MVVRDILPNTKNAARMGAAALALAGVLSGCSSTPLEDKKTTTPLAANKETSFANSLFVGEKNKKYNVLWLDGDDMSINLPVYGYDLGFETPNIDRLANEGITYTNFFTTNAQCAPSRAAMHTGMYPTTIGAHHMNVNNYDTEPGAFASDKAYEAVLPEGVKIFSEFMRNDGYYTAVQNKLDFQCGNGLVAWDIATRCFSGSEANSYPLGNDKPVTYENPYEGLWNQRNSDQPFFAHMTFIETHERFIWDKSCPPDNPYGPSVKDIAPYEVGEVPANINIDEVFVPPYFPDVDEAKANIARYYNQVMKVDKQIGEVLDQLEKEGDLDNTIIILFGDNGRGLPREKRSQWNSGIKIPLIVRFPDGLGAGTYNDELVSVVDLAPTTLSLAGIEVPDYMQGQVFLGKDRDKPREYVYSHKDRTDDLYDRTRSVENGKYHYIKNYFTDIKFSVYQPFLEVNSFMREWRAMNDNHSDLLTKENNGYFAEKKPVEELYDVVNDPFELNNLADDPEYADVKEELEVELQKWISETDIWTDYSGTKTLFEEETDMIKAMWPDMVQPVTEKPTIELVKDKVVLESATPGASIVYCLVSDNDTSESHHWLYYNTPISIDEDCTVLAQSLRYGYKISDVSSEEFTL